MSERVATYAFAVCHSRMMPNTPLRWLLQNQKAPLQVERLLPLRTAGEMLGVSLQQARKYARSGLMRVVRVGKYGKFRVPESEVVRLLGKRDDNQDTRTTSTK